MKVRIFSRFNRVFRPDDSRRNSLLNDPAWWDERLRVFKETAYRSLKAQTDQDFEFYAVFNIEQMEARQHIVDFAAKMSELPGVLIHLESHNPTTEYEPIGLSGLLFNLDSDDHLHKDTVKILKQYEPADGLMLYMDEGYIYDLNSGKLALYAGDGTPPPFWGAYIPERLGSVQERHRYMKDHRMDGHHYQKHLASNAKVLPAGLYLYSLHNRNTTNAWGNPHTAKHVREEVKRGKRKILEGFGYGKPA